MLGPSLQRKALFYRQVATMVKAALSLGRALTSAAPHTIGKLGLDMAREVESGTPLSGVMRRYPMAFSPYEAALVEAGEQGGSLERRLEDLAASTERAYNLQQELLGKLLYPAIILHVGAFIPPIYLMITKGVGAYVFAVLSVLVPMYGLALGGWLAWSLFLRTGPLRDTVDALMAGTPIVGSMVRNLALARFLHAASQLYDAGLSRNLVVQLAADACGNGYYRARLRSVLPVLDQGGKLSDALGALRILPPTSLQLIATGEETGSTAEMMARAAQIADDDARFAIARFMTILPVLMLLLMGAIVGYYVITFYTSTLNSIMNL